MTLRNTTIKGKLTATAG